MSQYKVPQNVEAEDKIIGPLTLKQFIYAIIGVGWGGLSFAILRNSIVVMIVIGVPPALLFILLAFYNKDGQTFEQLLISAVGFASNSRRRLWVKDEVVESFQITPRKVAKEQTQRDPVAVRSQLEHLAMMVDSRGWNQSEAVNTNLTLDASNDRLIMPAMPPEAVASEPAPTEDILDLQRSPLAQNLATLIDEAAGDVKEEAMEQMKAMHSAAARRQSQTAAKQSISGVTTPATPDILKLATQRDDLTVSQLAATATRMAPVPADQVVDVRKNG